jgi:benzoyl-CoA reductase subunit C
MTTVFEEVHARARHVLESTAGDAAADSKRADPARAVVGCFPVYTPVELVHASGARPVGLIGGGNRIEIAHADSRFQSFICSIVKSTLELGLTGRLDAMDAVVFHSICDPARNLASVFKRNFPRMAVEYLHLPQNIASPRAVEYLVAEYRRLLEALAPVTGHAASDADVRASLRLYNRVRALVRRLYAIRSEAPEMLSAAESYALVRAGTLLPVEEHLALLEEAVRALDARSARRRDRVRVVLEGSFCEQPPLELLEKLEAAGCYIMDDDFLLGWRWFLDDVPEPGDPLRNLAEAYLHGSVYSGTKHDLREPKADHLVKKVRDTQADAVIFLAAKFCEPALFDYALYRNALHAAGIPHLFLEFEEKMWVFDRVRGEVETFVESMLFD